MFATNFLNSGRKRKPIRDYRNPDRLKMRGIMSRILALNCIAILCFSVRAGDEAPVLDDAHRQLAAISEAAVVARVGSVVPKNAKGGGGVAIWITRSLSGVLRGGRDI